MHKKVSFKIKGMQRDLSASAFNKEYAFDNYNIRITATDSNTLLSVTNERGNKAIKDSSNKDIIIEGTPIGQAVVDNTIVLFTTDSADTIYTYNEEEGLKELYKGNLNFSTNNPIETLVYYENEQLQKVYWVDGKNQPRMINIKASEDIKNAWTNNSFDFVPTLQLFENVNIEREDSFNGSFTPGTIQYAFTYFNNYGQESNIFYISSLYYNSHKERGGSPEDKVNNIFKITIAKPDTNFDYIRVYSIHRSSIDATPEIKRVTDIDTKSFIYNDTFFSYFGGSSTVYFYDSFNQRRSFSEVFQPQPNSNSIIINAQGSLSFNKIEFPNAIIELDNESFEITKDDEDNLTFKYTSGKEFSTIGAYLFTDIGTIGDIVDPTLLLYIGGKNIIAGTMTQKDNTLFLGDLKTSSNKVSIELKNIIKDLSIEYINKTIEKTIASPEITQKSYLYKHQLKYNSQKFKTFKYLETYRFGLQFQNKFGVWSEPVFINDAQNTLSIENSYSSQEDIKLVQAALKLSKNTEDFFINAFRYAGYIKVRPVIVYPSLSDRECICQGILCPTVYNVKDRFENAPFVQSSWFIRPNAPFNIVKDEDKNYEDLETGASYSINSTGAITNNDKVVFSPNGPTFNLPEYGAWAEFRHNRAIPKNSYRNGEIQCIWWEGDVDSYPRPYIISKALNTWVTDNSANFYIDQSIVTLHSPDIEFDDTIKSLDMSGLKLRIVGLVPLTSFISDIDIQTAQGPISNSDVAGFYKIDVKAFNISKFGWRGLMHGAYIDKNNIDYASSSDDLMYVIYPFHRNGPVNGSGSTQYNSIGIIGSYYSGTTILDKKIISNLKYSYNTKYISNEINYNTSDIQVFDSNEVSLLKLHAPTGSSLNTINYYGNVDKIINPSYSGNIIGSNSRVEKSYPLVVRGNTPVISGAEREYFNVNFTPNNYWATDPVSMRYKSTPHAVLALEYEKQKQRILPTIIDTNNIVESLKENEHYFWDNNLTGVLQDEIDIANLEDNKKYGFLWLGEIYNPNVVNRFGGTSETAIESNQWLPCGEPVKIEDLLDLRWSEGDTYYQRYDHLKTYPFTQEEQNGIVEIVSFMCETRVNIDGRYDKNRGLDSNLHINNTNFNLLNPVYSQKNNFFIYRAINPNRLNIDSFPNVITWSLTKTAGELVDTWTNITLASILELDGDKGIVRSLQKFNNNIIAFQDTGISHILYNENMQISTTEGVPIEIANSGKVQGKRYLSNNIGCFNKWSICETSKGLYFIDDYNKSICVFNGQITNLSDSLGFHSWMQTNINNNPIWEPVGFNNFITYYDKETKEVLFITKDSCLAFSEFLNQFTSFYSYENTPYLSNIKNKSIVVHKDYGKYKLWEQHSGEYNKFFEQYKPFYTIVVVNPDILNDKIFNNIEFRADNFTESSGFKYLSDNTFTHLEVYNEYQYGKIALNWYKDKPSSLKKKFRIWRANIPRSEESNYRDRMRNPWIYLKLLHDTRENMNDKTVLHDLTVSYFE